MPTEVNASNGGGPGTQVDLGPQGAFYAEIPLNASAITVADAHADPADAPATPVLRVQVDAGGKCGVFVYSSLTGWVAVSLS